MPQEILENSKEIYKESVTIVTSQARLQKMICQISHVRYDVLFAMKICRFGLEIVLNELRRFINII